MKLKSKIVRNGNSCGLYIPKSFVDAEIFDREEEYIIIESDEFPGSFMVLRPEDYQALMQREGQVVEESHVEKKFATNNKVAPLKRKKWDIEEPNLTAYAINFCTQTPLMMEVIV